MHEINDTLYESPADFHECAKDLDVSHPIKGHLELKMLNRKLFFERKTMLCNK